MGYEKSLFSGVLDFRIVGKAASVFHLLLFFELQGRKGREGGKRKERDWVKKSVE